MRIGRTSGRLAVILAVMSVGAAVAGIGVKRGHQPPTPLRPPIAQSRLGNRAAFSRAKSVGVHGGRSAAAPRRPTGLYTALRVEPAALTLDNANDARRVVVSARTPDGNWVDVTQNARLRPASGEVRVDAAGYLEPVRPGSCRVVVAADGLQTWFPASVKSMALPPVSFVRDVEPVLSKIGCNAGTCHGAARGKNGFRLSLRGYDPAWDHYSLTQDISSRRISRSDPAQSLMLLKPTEGVPHRGGLVLDPHSRYYAILLRWITEGVKSDVGATARVNRLEVLPASPTLPMPGNRQQLVVIAHYPDGASRDVTRDAVYTSGEPNVATVTPDGLVTSVRRGEAPILIRYEGLYATDGVTVMGNRAGWRWVPESAGNYIDTLVYHKLQRVKSLPSPLCTDADFLRRISLDLIGIPPSPRQVRAFLADPLPSRQKRNLLIDRLLASPAFNDHWTNKWADLLDCNRKYLGEKGVWVFRHWIHDSVAQNKPYDQFVRELITASGDAYQNPPTNYYRVCRDTSTATEHVTQLFLGVRFACNKCHDHPFERWTQPQYYQMGAFFAQVALKPGDEAGDEIVYDNPDGGEVANPRDGKIMAPVVPFGAVYRKPGMTRRQMLAQWLTSPSNPFFARSMANRIWSYFLGRGIIEPVDDIRSGNPPSNPELLDALTRQFVKSGFNIKALMRTIVRSRTYQRSIRTNRWNEDDTINFSHALPRRLPAEELMDAITVATGVRPNFPGVPSGFTADQLPDSQVAPGGFLDLFGRPPRETPCECERTSTVSLSQAMNLINGPTIADALVDRKGRVSRLARTQKDPRALVKDLYLAALCRRPTAAEYARAARAMAGTRSRLGFAQDLTWALINSPAFLFNR